MAGTWDNGSPTSGDDVYTGDNFAESVNGGAGDDTIIGSGGADRLVGGAGSDSIDGGGGAEVIYGGLAPEDSDPIATPVDTFTVTTNTSGTAPQYRNDGFGERVAFHTDATGTGNETIEYAPITVVAGSSYDYNFEMTNIGDGAANFFGEVNIFDQNGTLLAS